MTYVLFILLQIFYVDRVCFRLKKDPRHFPIVTNWTTKMLHEREKKEMNGGCFGDGMPLDPIDIGEEPAHIDNLTINVQDQVDGASSNIGAEINIQVLTFAKKIASMAVEMMKIIQGAPKDVVQRSSFHRTLESALKSISCTPLQLTQQKVAETIGLSQYDDSFLNDEEVQKMLKDVDAEVAKRDECLSKLEEAPSFSFGLTQIWNNQAVVDALGHDVVVQDKNIQVF